MTFDILKVRGQMHCDIMIFSWKTERPLKVLLITVSQRMSLRLHSPRNRLLVPVPVCAQANIANATLLVLNIMYPVCVLVGFMNSQVF